MRALMIAMFMHSLLPCRAAHWEADWEIRIRLAAGIVAATDDVEEQLTLAKIARYEANYIEAVADCKVKGAAGEVTAFQIIPRNLAQRHALCQSYEGDARVALEHIRESTRACRHLPRQERLAIYTRGSCNSVEGRRLSTHRTPGDQVIAVFKTFLATANDNEISQEKAAWNNN